MALGWRVTVVVRVFRYGGLDEQADHSDHVQAQSIGTGVQVCDSEEAGQAVPPY